MKKIIYLLIFFVVNLSFSQDYNASIKSYLEQNQSRLALQTQDVSDIVMESQSFSKSLKAENVYVAQRYRGVKIFNSVSPFVVKNGKVIMANTASFVENLATKANGVNPSISAQVAISKAAAQLGLAAPSNLSLIKTVANNSFVFSDGNISLENIPVELVYQKMDNASSLRLAWDLSIYQLEANHYYSVRVDAQTGNIIDTNDWVVSCATENTSHSYENKNSVLYGQGPTINSSQSLVADESYRVFPIPTIGPNEGGSQLVLDPANAVASPYGWHDTNGAPGAEYTYTRGNNVLAQDDVNGNNGSGSRAEGGTNLIFDFPFNLPENPSNYLNGAITNLFYMNNIMHDIFYQYGFDEAAGNFQANNYENGGNGNDYVFADAQDGSGTNNANFGTPPDGGNPRMQMYLWSAPGTVLGTLMTVNNGPLAGQYYAFDSNFGGTPLPTAPITADLVIVEDDNAGTSTDTYDGCDNITNGSSVNGKIAVVRRGDCNFTVKVASAEAAGAIAVVVVNNVLTDPIQMGGTGAGIGIPAIMIYKEDGEAIISALLNGDTLNATLRNDGSGVDNSQRDGDLDNAVIGHEYGHGISNRLTGGPAAASCLQNAEQMGEGWSDYFGLMITMKTGDKGADPVGVGTYVIGQGPGGLGIRTEPYSTDMTINNFTYDLTNTAPFQNDVHALGSVWTEMLWDLTWDLIDEYGFDQDIYNGTGGNNIALQLVVDGLKLQRCSPGFVDGRDAILEADEITNGGANRCIIWRAFARRGLGLSADEGSSNRVDDQVPAYDVPEDCRLGVNDQGTINNNFIVYPNPSNGVVYIKAKQDLGNVSLSIFDMNGRKVFDKNMEVHSTSNIDASSLTPGIYLMKINGADYTQTTKLLIN